MTQAGEYVVVQFVTADGYCYGQLLDSRCRVLAELPYLSDVIGNMLIFDYPTGNLREAQIYEIGDLCEMAENKSGLGNTIADEQERVVFQK